MHRFHVPPEEITGGDIVLSREESRHALNVLRLRPGDIVQVLNGVGAVFHCELLGAASREARLRVLRRELQTPDPFRITLVQAVVKGKAMDLILQKAVELGVHRIIPVIADRTVAAVEGERAEDKRSKWHAVLVEAMKQSGNAWLPEISVPISFQSALTLAADGALHLVASLQPEAMHLRSAFAPQHSNRRTQPEAAAIWIGPEGDFTPEEAMGLQTAGVAPVSLGRNVLRSETAALAALAILRHELTAHAV